MYFPSPGLIIGFHGCEETVRDEIVSGKRAMTRSTNKHDWLGQGFYFWQNNYERALDFATNPPGKKRYNKPSVLGAVLDLQNCLDLLDTKYLKLVQASYFNQEILFREEGKPMPQNKPGLSTSDLVIRELDCTVIENVHSNLNDDEPFDSARGMFVEGDPLYPGAGFHEKNHIQICIRNPNCIKGFFIPREEVDWG
jgi:hypothetical protein